MAITYVHPAPGAQAEAMTWEGAGVSSDVAMVTVPLAGPGKSPPRTESVTKGIGLMHDLSRALMIRGGGVLW
jgi:hypothetical protein